MSSDKRSRSDRPSPGGARRPARTIDLKAEEIASTPAESVPPETTEASQQPGEAPAAAQVFVEEPTTQVVEPASASAAQAEVPIADTDNSGANPPPPSEPSLGRDSSMDRRPLGLLRLIGASALGAALALLVVYLWGTSFNRGSDASALDARVARMEQRLGELTTSPAVTSIDPRTVDDLASRLARLESLVTTLPRASAPDDALTNRIATLEGELRSLDEKIGVVGRRSDEIATMAGDARSRADAATGAVAALPKPAPQGPPAAERAEVEAVANRVAALERTAKGLEAEFAKRAAEGGDRSVRVAVTAAFLQAAVERGAPFTRELASAKTLGADASVLAPLEPFAASGVPSGSALAQELSALLPAMRQASGATANDGNFLGRLQANAEKLVRIRPTDETQGDDSSAVLTRVERQAGQSDIAGALTELAKLPPAARAPAQAWIAKAEARQTAVDTSRRFAADALAALDRPAQ